MEYIFLGVCNGTFLVGDSILLLSAILTKYMYIMDRHQKGIDLQNYASCIRTPSSFVLYTTAIGGLSN